MTKLVCEYFSVLVALVVGDAVWLSYFGKQIFLPAVGSAALAQPRWIAVIIFYVLYAAAILVFPLQLSGDAAANAGIYGATFGFAVYMTYDLTNLATLKPWTAKLAAMDVAWGTVLTCVASVAGVMAARLVA